MSSYGNNIIISSFKNSTSTIQYYIPTENEWYKAAYYDPSINNGIGGYWIYATKNNNQPAPVSANSIGNGLAGNTGNFANYNNQASWNNLAGNLTTVGTNGGPSYYGTFDQNGNVYEWTDTVINTERIIRGGSWSNTITTLSSSARSSIPLTTSLNNLGFRVAALTNENLQDFVSVSNVSNQKDTNNYGSVSYMYKIGRYLITNNNYTEFLNSVAKTDTYNLYNTSMASNLRGGITRSGSNGNYIYQSKLNMSNKPVIFVNWFDCARYCNWLTNGKPVGNQNSTTTENGSYTLNGASAGIIIKN